MVLNPGSERNLISICLKENDKLIEVEQRALYPEHLQVAGHRAIFMTMNYLHSKGVKADAMSVMEFLPKGKLLDDVNEVGGIDYLLTLQSSMVATENANIFIEKIKQSYTRKMLLDIADETKEFVMSDKAEVLNPSELMEFLEGRMTDANITSQEVDEVYKMGDSTDEVLKQRLENPNEVPGLEVGWKEFDKITNGGQGGDLIIVCAPSKTGKSVTLNNWASKLGVNDKLPVLYINTEMNDRDQEDRTLALLSGVPMNEIVNGMYVMDTEKGLAVDKIRAVQKAKEMLGEGNYYHIYMPQFTIEKVTALAKKFRKQFGIVALFFDYIKVPSNQADFKSSQEYQKLGFFTSGLKDLAGMMNIPVYSACQTNRANGGDNEEPSEADIGGSYRILQLASKLMFLYNKSPEKIAREGFDNGNQQLFIKWQRNGASDCPPINIMFHKEILKQEEV